MQLIQSLLWSFGKYFGPEHFKQIITISKKGLTPPQNKEKETNEKLKKQVLACNCVLVF